MGGLCLWAYRWGESASTLALLQSALYYFSLGMFHLDDWLISLDLSPIHGFDMKTEEK